MIRFVSVLLAALSLSGVPAGAATIAAPPARASAPAVTAQDLGAFFDGLVPYAIKRAGIAGGVLVVVKDGKVLFEKGYGYSDLAKRTAVSPSGTIFRPGSISKLFTWTAVMQQVQAGKLNLDTDVNTYLDFKIPPKFGKRITLRNLMTHSAGFEETARDLLVDKKSQLYPLRDYLIKRMPPRIFPPGQIIAYSNYGAALAGYIVQRVSGEPYDQYILKHILQPLRMQHSSFTQPLPGSLDAFMAKGYTSTAAEKPTPFEFVEASPAGSGSTTGADMTRFMLAYLGGGSYDGGTILSPATVKQMFTVQLPAAPGMNGFDLGFYQENRNGQVIVGHGGDTGVFHSDLHLMLGQHIGMFMSFNSAGKAGAVEAVRVQIFREFLDRYFPYTPPAEATVANPKADAARVAGWYTSSRRIERALSLVYALGQTSVTARPDGTIEVGMLTDPAGDPERWREVGPLYYRQVNGQAHLKFVADSSGHIVYWTSDDFIPVFVFQRVDGLKTMGSIKTLLLLFVAIIVISLLIRLGAWIARRRLGLKLDLTPAERWVHLAARIGAVAFLVALGGWIVALSSENSLLSSSFTNVMVVLYILGLIAILGGIAMIVETIMRVMHGPGGWLVRSGEIIVALAAIYGIWFFLAFGLANFVTNF